MAFQAPQRPHAQRPQVQVSTTSTRPSPSQTQTSPQAQHATREWVLFSPHPSSATLSTPHTLGTIGRSQLSELGSLQTGDASFHAEEDAGREDDETEDLDSLDDGLYAFGDPTRALHRSTGTDTVLPAHDGLGTFPGSSAMVQDQFWQHERYNPRRRRRSTGSRRMQSPNLRRTNDMSTLQEEQDKMAEQEQWKMRRIEEWRLEQSRAILEEIERETRRRRRASTTRPAAASETLASSSTGTSQIRERQASATSATAASAEDDGLLTRFTKKVIRDLIGIDDATLCYIFGEDLPNEEELSSTPRQSEVFRIPDPPPELALGRLGSSWEERLVKRIARELGILVNQLTEHPGAFTTYSNTIEEHIPYAGITSSASSAPSTSQQRITTPPANPSTPDFQPTLRQPSAPHNPVATASSAWGVDESEPTQPLGTHSSHLRHETDHWERELNIKMVFNFLRARFLRRASSSSSPPQPIMSPTPTTNATSPAQQSRAQLIRQNHPLISRTAAATNRQRTQQQQQQSQPPPTLASVLGRRVLSESSCASQSSKRTKTRTGSVSVSVARSQNYWDWGVGSDAPGAWGEA